MTGEDFKAKALEILRKYDHGYFDIADAGTALWKLLNEVDAEERYPTTTRVSTDD